MGASCSSASKSILFSVRLEKIEYRSMKNRKCNVEIHYGAKNPILFNDVQISMNLSLAKDSIKLAKRDAEKVILFYVEIYFIVEIKIYLGLH